MATPTTRKTSTNESIEAQTVAETTGQESPKTTTTEAVQPKTTEAVALFDTTKKVLTSADMVAIASSGVFEKEGTDLSSKLANAEFWEENKGVEFNIVFEGIIPWESTDEAMEDTEGAVCHIIDKSGKSEKIVILNSLPVSEFKKYGAGAYKISYLGKKRSTRNSMYSYADFKITLQQTFTK